MRYAKLNNGQISYAPNPILHDGLWYGNPSAEVYLTEGYKPVVFSTQPEPLGDGYYVEKWTETFTNIVQNWEWVEDDSVSAEEAIEILFGEDSL